MPWCLEQHCRGLHLIECVSSGAILAHLPPPPHPRFPLLQMPWHGCPFLGLLLTESCLLSMTSKERGRAIITGATSGQSQSCCPTGGLARLRPQISALSNRQSHLQGPRATLCPENCLQRQQDAVVRTAGLMTTGLKSKPKFRTSVTVAARLHR